jgi:Protein of unknown function (DUF2510)
VFDKHKEKRAQAAWQEAHDTLESLLAVVEGRDDPEDPPIELKRGERAALVLNGAGLFESRRGAGHWEGRSQGVSIPLGGTGMRYRVGRSRGHFVQGTEAPTIIDRGTIVVTTQRVVFVGAIRSTEWAFAKLVSIQNYEQRPWTAIAVSNRQKVSGFVYDAEHQDHVRIMLELATAIFDGETQELAADLRHQIAEHELQRPAAAAVGEPSRAESVGPPAPPGVPVATPAGWYTDPTGNGGLRWWDGKAWTEHLADAGAPPPPGQVRHE